MARPRVEADFAIVLRMRDVEHLGWSRMAEEYRKLSGRFISRDTIKRRYFEAKEIQTKLPRPVATVEVKRATEVLKVKPPLHQAYHRVAGKSPALWVSLIAIAQAIDKNNNPPKQIHQLKFKQVK